MKTQSKLSLFVLVLVAIIAASCKGKPASGTGSDSGSSSGSGGAASGTVSDSKRAGVIDSLGITNPEEKKLCVLYDEAISEYIKEIEIVASDTTRLKTFQDSALRKGLLRNLKNWSLK